MLLRFGGHSILTFPPASAGVPLHLHYSRYRAGDLRADPKNPHSA